MPGLITVTLIEAHNMQPLFSNVATLVNQHMIIYNYIMLHLILYQKNWTLMNPNLSYRSVQEIKENDFFLLCDANCCKKKLLIFPSQLKLTSSLVLGITMQLMKTTLKTQFLSFFILSNLAIPGNFVFHFCFEPTCLILIHIASMWGCYRIFNLTQFSSGS